MKYLLILLIFTGCVTINKTYLPQAKKDTVYLPCNQIHVAYSDYPVWRSEPFNVPIKWDTAQFMFSPGVLDTSNTINGTIRVWDNDSIYIVNGKKIFGGGGGYSITDTTHKPLKHKKEVKPKCEHRYTSTTLMGCEGGPCNTCKCLSCGYTWSCW